MDISNRHFLPIDLSESPIRYSKRVEYYNDSVSEEDLPPPPSSSRYLNTPSRRADGRAKGDLRLSELTPLPIPPKHIDTERVDDMFARKQRDSYQVMGIDLTPYSTRGRALEDRSSSPPSPTYKSLSRRPRKSAVRD